MRIVLLTGLMGVLMAVGAAAAGPAEKPAAPVDAATRKAMVEAIDRGLAFLDKTQNADGTWSTRQYPAITALAARAYLDHPDAKYTRTSPQVAKALKAIVAAAKDGGRDGIHENVLENYNTSISVSTLAAAKDPTYAPIITAARTFLADKMIWSEKSRNVTKSDLRYGGSGYGKGTGTSAPGTTLPGRTSPARPDLSNTQWMVEALAESGMAATDPSFERVTVFVRRCQNVKDADSAPDAGNDGGFYYAPDPPESKAGRDPAGGLKSYGGMTYAGFKSFLYSGMKKDDPRVRAAWDWIRKNYTVETNPGLGKPGLYYYYVTMAKALQAYGEPVIVDENGGKHNWREDLGRQIVKVQAANGSWSNDADRWEEGDPALVTAYAMLAMEYCLAAPK